MSTKTVRRKVFVYENRRIFLNFYNTRQLILYALKSNLFVQFLNIYIYFFNRVFYSQFIESLFGELEGLLNKCYSNKLIIYIKKNRYIDRFIFLFHEARQIGIRQMGKNIIFVQSAKYRNRLASSTLICKPSDRFYGCSSSKTSRQMTHIPPRQWPSFVSLRRFEKKNLKFS